MKTNNMIHHINRLQKKTYITTSFDVEKHFNRFLAIHNNNYNKYFNELGIKGMCLNVVKDIHGKVTITSYPVLKPQSFPLQSVTR